jgi:hypothetical protein
VIADATRDLKRLPSTPRGTTRSQRQPTPPRKQSPPHSAAFPAHAIPATTAAPAEADYRWIVEPIDGGSTSSTVSLRRVDRPTHGSEITHAVADRCATSCLAAAARARN